MRPDASAFGAFLAQASRRVAVATVAQGAAVGLILATLLFIAGWPARGLSGTLVGLALTGAGVAGALIVSRGRRREIAHLVERRAPVCRNLVVTAAELPGRTGVAEHIASVVYDQATRVTKTLDLPALFPTRNAIAATAVAAGLWVVVLANPSAARAVRGASSSSATGVDATIDAVEVTVTPPAYAGQPTKTLRDPSRIEALVGSRIRVTTRARAAGVVLETLQSKDTMASSGAGQFAADLAATTDGYISIQALPSAPSPQRPIASSPHRLIGLSVISDDPARVRITAPARDLVLPNARQTIDVTIEASDDIGLASLRLRYTKVSGSGERFTFTEGEVPITVTRTDARSWRARASWRLDSLALDPGDMVVYRAVAADHRPGATPTESDAFIAEVPTPGGQAAPGFAVDPEQERYAVSQQMVIIKTERLAARRSAMTGEAYATAAQEIAAEQRKVRAEFVFMMGGELSDVPDETSDMTEINEEAEAAGEDDLLAGRAANQGRLALLRAIRYMSRAATALTSAQLTPALTHERAALVQLERAFARTRIILRALTERERLDLSRRLTGGLADAARSARPRAEAPAEPRALELRRSLAGIASLTNVRGYTANDAGRTALLAENVLRVDPRDTTLHAVAALLTSASGAMQRSANDDARTLLDRAATALAGALRSDLPAGPRRGDAIDIHRLGGALTDALRTSRGGR